MIRPPSAESGWHEVSDEGAALLNRGGGVPLGFGVVSYALSVEFA
ncbi:hypothetical protein [Rhodococcus gannanensis]|uniref:Uncharacterized protein n=1 Tax=Rhodococcus gannanensis TaxID=1960308 RepID=A0ABW4NXZ4_9NOCA